MTRSELASLVLSSEFSRSAASTSGAAGPCPFASRGESSGDGEEGNEVEELVEVVDEAEIEDDGEAVDTFLRPG